MQLELLVWLCPAACVVCAVFVALESAVLDSV
jgi:hypothetical protein